MGGDDDWRFQVCPANAAAEPWVWLRLIGIGVVAGIPAALALMQVVQSQLFGLTGHDPRTLAIATVALTVVACAAGYIPALRASRLDPMKALRYE